MLASGVRRPRPACASAAAAGSSMRLLKKNLAQAAWRPVMWPTSSAKSGRSSGSPPMNTKLRAPSAAHWSMTSFHSAVVSSPAPDSAPLS